MSKIRPHKIISDIVLQHSLVIFLWFCVTANNGAIFMPFNRSFEDISAMVENFLENAVPNADVFKHYFGFIFFQFMLARFVGGEEYYGYNCEPVVYKVRWIQQYKFHEDKYTGAWTLPYIKRTVEKESKDESLPFRCNGFFCFYISIFVWYILETSGIVEIRHLAENYSKYIAVSIITSNVLAVICLIGGQTMKSQKEKVRLRRTSTNDPSGPPTPITPTRRVTRHATSQLLMQQEVPTVVRDSEVDRFDSYNTTGNTNTIISEFYNGLIINHRMPHRINDKINNTVDLKIFTELRISWFFAFFMSLSMVHTALRADENKLTLDMVALFIAIWIIVNAKAKFEHTLPSAYQDTLSQSYGWKTIFYNFTFIPFMYTFNLYFLYQDYTVEREHDWTVSKTFPLFLFLIGYYVFDTAFCQRHSHKYTNFFRRSTFPNFSFSDLGPNPRLKMSSFGGSFVIDGWFAFSRKVQYAGEMIMALSLGLMCCKFDFDGSDSNFDSEYWVLPFVIFVVTVVKKLQSHYIEEVMAVEKYGAAWNEYKKQVPSIFFPYLIELIPFLIGARDKPIIR